MAPTTTRPTSYTLTRTPHQVGAGEPPQEPELLETYIDGRDGSAWTGGYLRHEIGDAQVVPAYVAEIVMGDPGLRKHYRCDPPFAFEPETFTETHDAPIVAPDADE
jgi:hypothetical protein